MCSKFGGGGEHVGHRVAQIDAAVAVEIDAVFDVGRRQELRLPDLAGIGADQVTQGKIAALHDLQRREQFALEQLGAAAIMREGSQRADHRKLAHVALAEIGLQSPDRDQDLPGHAEPRLDPRQQCRVTGQHRPAAIDASRADAGRDILLEGLVESVALAAVEIQHGRVIADACEGGADHVLRDAGGPRIRRHARQKAVEVAAAFGGKRGACGDDGGEHDGRKKFAHANPLLLPDGPTMP